MAYESPLFQSSLDLFAHSIEHFNRGTERDRKFVILHLANSVELILKDLLLDLGESIYKNPKETISTVGAISTLTKEKGINIPNLNKLELLIDERNALQHRYGFPNELTTIFYMDATYIFFEEFLKLNYSLEIDEVLEEFLTYEVITTFKLRKVSTEGELGKLFKLAKEHPVGSLLSGYAYFEKLLSFIKENINLESKTPNSRLVQYFRPTHLTKIFEEFGMPLSIDLSKKLDVLIEDRNQAAHGRNEPISEVVIEHLKTIQRIEPLINKLNEKVKEWADSKNSDEKNEEE